MTGPVSKSVSGAKRFVDKDAHDKYLAYQKAYRERNRENNRRYRAKRKALAEEPVAVSELLGRWARASRRPPCWR